jgi:hypothetical protein
MTKNEVLALALEALENSVDLVREDAYNAEKLYGNYPSRQGKVRGLKVLADDHEKAITAIKQALEQPVQKPVLWLINGVVQASDIPTDYTGCFYTTPPAARPVLPDALNPKDENPAYAAGWNDCRAEMLKGMKP